MAIYLTNNPARFHPDAAMPDTIWNNGASGFLKSVDPPRTKQILIQKSTWKHTKQALNRFQNTEKVANFAPHMGVPTPPRLKLLACPGQSTDGGPAPDPHNRLALCADHGEPLICQLLLNLISGPV